jgi:hypothetical protein
LEIGFGFSSDAKTGTALSSPGKESILLLAKRFQQLAHSFE